MLLSPRKNGRKDSFFEVRAFKGTRFSLPGTRHHSRVPKHLLTQNVPSKGKIGVVFLQRERERQSPPFVGLIFHSLVFWSFGKAKKHPKHQGNSTPSEPRRSRPISLISLVSRDMPNFLAPTPSRGRPLPHRKISGLKSLGLGSFSVSDVNTTC